MTTRREDDRPDTRAPDEGARDDEDLAALERWLAPRVAPEVEALDGLRWQSCVTLARPPSIHGAALDRVAIAWDQRKDVVGRWGEESADDTDPADAGEATPADVEETWFELPEPIAADYDAYVEEFWFEKGFARDETKLMLTRPPARGAGDAIGLTVTRARFSEVQFFRDAVLAEPDLHALLLERAVADGDFRVPTSLCVHVVAETTDGAVLLARRAPHLAYHPGAWTCSLEEQLDPADLEDGPNAAIERGVERALLEELALGSDAWDADASRVLSVFLEADKLNPGVCVRAALAVDRATVAAALDAMPAERRELTDATFLDAEGLLDLLERPQDALHPATGYRVLLALLDRWGPAELLARLSG